MTIGELEAMLDLQNIDPFTVVKLLEDLRFFFRTFVSEFIDVYVNGNAEDEFKQFDIVLSGEVPFPRRDAAFFHLPFLYPVGGLFELTFSIEAGGFSDLKIPLSLALVSMKAKGGIVPMIGSYVASRLSVGFVIYIDLVLKADVMHTSFPVIAELLFSKFPMDVGSRMDIQVIPLIIRLKIKVTTRFPFKLTLYDKELFRWQANAMVGNVFNNHIKDHDDSPPVVMAYSTPVGTSTSTPHFAEQTTNCNIEQVPKLDYTEPAFQLEVVAVDDKSRVTFFYQVGTVAGGSDVLPKTEFGGPSAIISQILIGGHPLHFTVYAMNDDGGTSIATCSLPTFDITLPTGRITPDFISTSHPHILRASAVVYDDSVILMQKKGLGFGPAIWGDQIIPWHTIDLTKRENVKHSRNYGSILNNFVFLKSGIKVKGYYKICPFHVKNYKSWEYMCDVIRPL